jgi:hypothetical protein
MRNFTPFEWVKNRKKDEALMKNEGLPHTAVLIEWGIDE